MKKEKPSKIVGNSRKMSSTFLQIYLLHACFHSGHCVVWAKFWFFKSVEILCRSPANSMGLGTATEKSELNDSRTQELVTEFPDSFCTTGNFLISISEIIIISLQSSMKLTTSQSLKRFCPYQSYSGFRFRKLPVKNKLFKISFRRWIATNTHLDTFGFF